MTERNEAPTATTRPTIADCPINYEDVLANRGQRLASFDPSVFIPFARQIRSVLDAAGASPQVWLQSGAPVAADAPGILTDARLGALLYSVLEPDVAMQVSGHGVNALYRDLLRLVVKNLNQGVRRRLAEWHNWGYDHSTSVSFNMARLRSLIAIMRLHPTTRAQA